MPVFGWTLADLIARKKQLLPVCAAKLVAQTADGLAAAHEKGIMHRDIRPSILLLDDGGSLVFVSDFGIACRTGADEVAGGSAAG